MTENKYLENYKAVYLKEKEKELIRSYIKKIEDVNNALKSSADVLLVLKGLTDKKDMLGDYLSKMSEQLINLHEMYEFIADELTKDIKIPKQNKLFDDGDCEFPF